MTKTWKEILEVREWPRLSEQRSRSAPPRPSPPQQRRPRRRLQESEIKELRVGLFCHSFHPMLYCSFSPSILWSVKMTYPRGHVYQECCQHAILPPDQGQEVWEEVQEKRQWGDCRQKLARKAKQGSHADRGTGGGKWVLVESHDVDQEWKHVGADRTVMMTWLKKVDDPG